MTLSRKHIKVSPPPMKHVLSRPPCLRSDPTDVPAITVLRDGHLVSRASDFIMYLVEAEFVDNVVSQYGPCNSVLFHPKRSLTRLCSDEARCDCFRPDICEGP